MTQPATVSSRNDVWILEKRVKKSSPNPFLEKEGEFQWKFPSFSKRGQGWFKTVKWRICIPFYRDWAQAKRVPSLAGFVGKGEVRMTEGFYCHSEQSEESNLKIINTFIERWSEKIFKWFEIKKIDSY